jgi:poly-gamma-glutamate capsule biosynthesis protein CapA/YwtB (metallophosphatase superfamily)
MGGRPALLAGLTVALLLSACDGTGTGAGAGDDASAQKQSPSVQEPSAPEPSPSTPHEPDPSQPEPAPPPPLRIAFAGDVHFEGALEGRLDDPSTALVSATGSLAAADLAMVNLETSVGSGGRPDPHKRFTFQAPATALTALAAAGVDVVTMANNHAVDYGAAVLPSTFDAVAAAARADPPLAVVGIGRDVRDAFRPAVSDVDGTVVATLGATIADTDPTADPTGHWAATSTSAGTADAVDPGRLLRAVEKADAYADVVVVYMHWGTQGESCPAGSQRSLAGALVRHGADIVVGSHAHRLQGDGALGAGYVAYGLGNYVWYTPSSGPSVDSGVLTLTVQPAASPGLHATVTETAWEPAEIGADGLPAALSRRPAEEFRAELAVLRECAGLAGPG